MINAGIGEERFSQIILITMEEALMKEEYSITLTQFIEKMNLRNYTPEIDTDAIHIIDPDINRPALQLAGFFEHFLVVDDSAAHDSHDRIGISRSLIVNCVRALREVEFLVEFLD